MRKIMNENKFIVYIDEEIKDIVPIFIEGRHKDIEKLMKCLDSEDYEGIKRMGHNMKGTGGGYGFMKIMEIGANIEKFAAEKNREAIKEKINELLNYLNNLEIIYVSRD